MKFNLKPRLIRKEQRIKWKTTRSISDFTSIHLLIKNKRAVSAVLSNLIMIAAVIALGFSVLAYATQTSSNYQSQYSQSVNSDINKMKETLSFEYAFYNTTNSKIYVYFLNSGSNDINITVVSINDSSQSFTLHSMNGQLIQNQTVASGKEGYLQISNSTRTNIIKLSTLRGSTFAYNVFV